MRTYQQRLFAVPRPLVLGDGMPEPWIKWNEDDGDYEIYADEQCTTLIGVAPTMDAALAMRGAS